MMNKFSEDAYVDVLNRSLRFKRSGGYDQAIELTKKAIQLDPNRPTAYYNLGKLLYIIEQYEPSVKSYQKAIEFGWDADQVILHLGQSILSQNIKDQGDILFMKYRTTIDPHFKRTLSSHDEYKLDRRISKKEYEQFEGKGIDVAVKYMNDLIGE